MATILTSIHGRRAGLSSTGRLVVKSGDSAVQASDAGSILRPQGAPGTLNATGTLTAALVRNGIVTSTTASAVTATVNTGTAMDTALADIVEIGEGVEWSAINTGGTNAFTVTAATGHTLVGAGAVAALSSGRFFSRRTAANTWVTYRLA